MDRVKEQAELADGSAPVKSGARVVAVFAVIVVLGFIVRVVLSAISLGSNDWFTWHSFGLCTLGDGLFRPYELDSNLNHPPIPTLWSALAEAITFIAAFLFPDSFQTGL